MAAEKQPHGEQEPVMVPGAGEGTRKCHHCGQVKPVIGFHCESPTCDWCVNCASKHGVKRTVL